MDPVHGFPKSLLRTLHDSRTARSRYVAHTRRRVHDVAHLAPGLYGWRGPHHAVRATPLREEVYKACMDQNLGADTAFVVIATADGSGLDGTAGYREGRRLYRRRG